VVRHWQVVLEKRPLNGCSSSFQVTCISLLPLVTFFLQFFQKRNFGDKGKIFYRSDAHPVAQLTALKH